VPGGPWGLADAGRPTHTSSMIIVTPGARTRPAVPASLPHGQSSSTPRARGEADAVVLLHQRAALEDPSAACSNSSSRSGSSDGTHQERGRSPAAAPSTPRASRACCRPPRSAWCDHQLGCARSGLHQRTDGVGGAVQVLEAHQRERGVAPSGTVSNTAWARTPASPRSR